MGQIVFNGQKPKYCNLTAITTGSKKDYVIPSGEVWLIDSTNASKADGTGKYDFYIIGDNSKTASQLAADKVRIDDNDEIVIDANPTNGSNNAVSSGGVKDALDGKQDEISNVSVVVDANVGTPSGSVSFNNNTLAFSFSNLKGAKGDTGAQGATGPAGPQGPKGDAGITGDVSDLTIVQTVDTTTAYTATDVAGASAVQEVSKSMLDYFIIHRKENFSGWAHGGSSNGTTAYPLYAGTTYELVFDNSAKVYFRWWDENDNAYTPLNNTSVTGPYTYLFTPSVDVVKLNFYSSVTNTFTIRTKNLNRSVLLKDDVVNNLTDGGINVPLSAEQGKVLNQSVSVLNKYNIPLSKGAIYDTRGAITGNTSFTYARTIFANNGFDTLYVKDGYEYRLYIGDVATYINVTPGSLTKVTNSFVTYPYVNTSNKAYFWIEVKKTSGNAIEAEELFDIVTLEYGSSVYNFKTLNDVDEYYKFGTQCLIENIEIVTGEKWNNINGTKQTGTSYTRTGYIDVSNVDALRFNVRTYTDAENGNASALVFAWFDSEYNQIGWSYYIGKRKDNVLIVGVPHNASYVSMNGSYRSIRAFKHEKNVADAHYYSNGFSVIGKLPRVSLIIMYGQSLSVGSDASAITVSQRYYPLRMLFDSNASSVDWQWDKSFAPLQAKDAGVLESPCYGAGEMIVESIAKENGISVYANEWERHYIVFVSCGAGQTNITQLKDGSSLYGRVETAITNTKNLCDEFGFTMDVPAWIWFQGEQDIKAQPNDGVPAISTPNEYKAALLALHEKICASITTITGSTKRPKCAIYQPGSQCLYSQTYNFANSYLAFNNAYVDLLKNNDEFIAVAPVYIFDGSDPNHVPNSGNPNGGFIHLDARGYKTLGAYAGYAIKRSIIDGVKITGVIPKNITVSGTTISIKYSVPCPPLKFDTEWVKEPPLTNGVHNYGFNVIKSDNTELITNVSVFDDTVTIECSESPIGAKLRYGLNGDVYHYPNSEYNGADGRIHGGRGNLRDSQGDYVQKEIRELGQTIRLDNWAYCFEELLEEPEE